MPLLEGRGRRDGLTMSREVAGEDFGASWACWHPSGD